MRLLLVNYEYPPVGAGAATATQAIARDLTQLGHEVVVMTARYGDLPANAQEDGVTVCRIPSRRRAVDRSSILEMASFLVSGLIAVPRIIRQHKTEGIIAFFSMPSGPIALRGRNVSGAPYVVSLRGGDVPGTEPSLKLVHWILRPLRRAVFKKSVAVVANSEGLRAMAEAADPFAVRVIPNGVDTDFFRPPDSRSDAKKLRILFVGRFQEQKNLPLLFRQAAQLPPASFELHLVGDGPEKESLKGLGEKLSIDSAITWHGWLPRDELRRVYQSCDCLVNPSFYEGLPNAVLEAMACGLPVIASNVAGNQSAVVPNATGYLFDLTDPDTLSEALHRLLGDRALADRLGQNGRAHVLKHFSWSVAAKAYLACFSEERTG